MRTIAGPMMCAATGASGSLRIGIGGSLPALQDRSAPASSTVIAPGVRPSGVPMTLPLLLRRQIPPSGAAQGGRPAGVLPWKNCGQGAITLVPSLLSRRPAILAQRYLAAKTSTGVSVVYGNAGIP